MALSDDARAGMAAGALDGLIRCGEDLLGRAQRIAPWEEGTLSGSAALVIIVGGQRFEGAGSRAAAMAAATAAARARRRPELEVEVSFNTVYAARQHEELEWAHAPGRQAKYLEAPFLAQSDRYRRIIGLAARRGAEGGGPV